MHFGAHAISAYKRIWALVVGLWACVSHPSWFIRKAPESHEEVSGGVVLAAPQQAEARRGNGERVR